GEIRLSPILPALAPPLPAQSPLVRLLWFHTFSGIYESAVSAGAAVEAQYLLGVPLSLNIVPPTATLKGVEASALTETGYFAGALLGASQPSAPLSPAETK